MTGDRMRTRWGALMAISVMGTQLALGQSEYRDWKKMECPILDMPFSQSGSIEAGVVFPADTEAVGWKNLSVAEYGIWYRLFDLENTLGSDVEVRMQWDGMVLGMNDNDSTYGLNMGAIRAQWSQRFVEGWGFEVDASPGVYSGLQGGGGDDFASPCGIAFTKAFSPSCAIFLGASVYPGFDMVVDPRGGVRVVSGEGFTLDLAYPETRLTFGSSRSILFSLGARVWLWPEFNMGDDPRGRLRYDEARADGTLQFALTESMGLTLKGGYVFGREISFENGGAVVEVDDAPFARIGFCGCL